ncbi:MAG: hypothetical protein ABJ360_16300 [Roseobacter sp.]|uniref:hypothetical protein n=1 Tax=Alphaproteobacteria TaxID=28211 RepID=UPI0032647F10
MRHSSFLGITFTLVQLTFATSALAQNTPEQTLFTNVHIFDGVNEERIENANVLVDAESRERGIKTIQLIMKTAKSTRTHWSNPCDVS